ncbi:hypothetical protein MRS44_017148 [Fusarium solani]|uniref:Uncharacterized protein n=1 Tax=Fusarium solani TaxID=169388 RepID=A0A9P9GS48_FUSSL|nr:uncharacterized protein B0J15DRAFT_552649 [Fusarium solani]KAH7243782.1 hypothetical protein B0J15DRAFT_552649 [Fusarium solani]KAJ3455666.1 hypothetical protein MRS44_017148 [Fusarium solani]
MSYPTKPCFVGSFKGWDNEALKHPALQYLNDLNTDFGETKVAHSGPHTKWSTQDWEFQAQNGQVLRGEEAWKRLIHSARFYDKLSIDPLCAFIQDTEDGYDGILYANLYTNFVKPGEKNQSDNKGIEWEMRIPRTYRLTFVKDSSGPHGLKLSKLAIVGDVMGTMATAVRKGLVSQENAFRF